MKAVRDKNPKFFFSARETKRVVDAIRRAERNTSAEIRVHLKTCFDGDPLAHASKLFERLGMTHTAHRNGVLILFGVRDRRFAVLGDKGIHEKVGPGFWEGIAQTMQSHFREDRFSDGLVEGIREIGTVLSARFPRARNDRNELPDGLSSSW